MTKFQNRKEEEELKLGNGFEKNYGILYIVGGAYSKGLLSKVNIFLYYALHLIHVPFQCVTVYVSNDDLGLRVESAHWVVMLSNTMVISATLLKHRQALDRIFIKLGENFYEYGDTVDDETRKEINSLLKESEKTINFLAKSFIAIILVTGGVLTTVRSIIEALSGRLAEPMRENGVLTNVPISMWYPVDLVGGYKAILTAVQCYGAVVTAGLVMSFNVGFAFQAHSVHTQFKILALTLKHVDRRAKHIFDTHSESKFKKYDEDFLKPKLFDACLRACLTDSVKHHQILIRFCSDLQEYSYIAALAITFTSTLLLCFSAYVFNAGVPATVKSTFLCMLIAELAQCFLFCWYSQKLYDTHNFILEGLYMSNWVEFSKVVRPYWLIIQAMCCVPLGISAGGIHTVNLRVFVKVVQSAFSYYSMLQTKAFSGAAD